MPIVDKADVIYKTYEIDQRLTYLILNNIKCILNHRTQHL